MKIINRDAGIIRQVVKDLVELLAKTYGPAGKTILLSDGRAADDGKLVARDYEPQDEVENQVVSYVIEAMEKTDSRVGDGTTTSAILLGAIIEAVLGNSLVQAGHGAILELQKGLKEAVSQIEKQSKPIKTKKELHEIVLNSYNDPEIAELISETLFKIGKDGVFSIDNSTTAQTTCEIVDGLEIDKGFVSPYFINDNDGVLLKNPKIVLINGRLDSVKELPLIASKAINLQNKNLVIFAEGFSDEVISTLVINKMQGNLSPLLIENPGFGEAKPELLKDILSVVGGRIIDKPAGDTVDKLTEADLGSCATITSKRYSTVIAGGKGNTKLRIKELKANKEDNQDKIRKRIASLEGGVAVLKVGAYTENEQKTKKFKAEDAINAAQIAYRDGVVAGGGVAFEKVETSSPILNKALKQPRITLEANGKEYLDDNVLDPTGVLVAALESAVSIACGLIRMGGVIANKREDKDKHDY